MFDRELFAQEHCLEIMYERRLESSTAYVYGAMVPIPHPTKIGHMTINYTVTLNVEQNTFKFEHLYEDNMFATISTGDFGSLDDNKHFLKNMKKFEKVLMKCYGRYGLI